jgi:hypothetical protein
LDEQLSVGRPRFEDPESNADRVVLDEVLIAEFFGLFRRQAACSWSWEPACLKSVTV